VAWKRRRSSAGRRARPGSGCARPPANAGTRRHLSAAHLTPPLPGTNRGASAKLARHRVIKGLIGELERAAPPLELAAIDGLWELVYTTAEAFRSSPFFWAFQEGLVQDTDLASAIFRFTDSIPGASIGRAVQRIDLAAGLLISDVEMETFPGLRGTVTTTSTITGERVKGMEE